MGQRTPQFHPCLICGTVVTLPKMVPGGWWLTLTTNWVNPPALTAEGAKPSNPESPGEYVVKVKANGYTVKSILPYLCPECQARLRSDAELIWEARDGA